MLREGWSEEFKLPCVVVDSASSFSALEVMRLARKIGAEINSGVDHCFLVEFKPGAPGPYTDEALYASVRENSLAGRTIRIKFVFKNKTFDYKAKVAKDDGVALDLTDAEDLSGEEPRKLLEKYKVVRTAETKIFLLDE